MENDDVALRARAWIETHLSLRPCVHEEVALRARAWIETLVARSQRSNPASPSARGRGLKHRVVVIVDRLHAVALRARAWIETWFAVDRLDQARGRPPREGVD